jgi:predicted transcriptional regulator
MAIARQVAPRLFEGYSPSEIAVELKISSSSAVSALLRELREEPTSGQTTVKGSRRSEGVKGPFCPPRNRGATEPHAE